MTPTNSPALDAERRIVINRCYGNPVPRRNQSDNSTDMSSFPFVRHHFLRAGFEVIDCPPLTAQLKNSADIRMVMDVRDLLTHDTYFDEFVILSADADFTPVLHRLRSHARRTVIFSNDHTAAPYTAICDAEIREADLLSLLIDGQLTEPEPGPREPQALPSAASIEALRNEILTEVANLVRAADAPVPLEALADRCVRVLGHEKTVGAAWGGTGSFRDLLTRGLPEDIRLTGQPPYFVYDATRAAQAEAPRIENARREQRIASARRHGTPASRCAPRRPPRALAPLLGAQPAQRACRCASRGPRPDAARSAGPGAARNPLGSAGASSPAGPPARSARPTARPRSSSRSRASTRPARRRRCRRRTTARCSTSWRRRSPPTASPARRRWSTSSSAPRAIGIEIRRDDVRFVLDVVSEADPWFDQGASPTLFASRFRNFVVARCRGQGLNLSADELDLIEAWFAAPIGRSGAGAAGTGRLCAFAPAAAGNGRLRSARRTRRRAAARRRAIAGGTPMSRPAEQQATGTGDEFPRIIRTRLRG